jgi:hypothetical protein
MALKRTFPAGQAESDTDSPQLGSSHRVQEGEWPVLRKYILGQCRAAPAALAAEKDLAAIATVFVTSETAEHPIEYVFDTQRGRGGSRWVAATPGEQVLLLAFDTPQTLRRVTVEIEEAAVSRTQELEVAVSSDGGQTYHTLRRQDYTFSPPGTTFEREAWDVAAEAVTHLRLRIIPDKGGTPCRATLTSLTLE